MAEPEADLKGLLARNTPGLGHTTAYRLDNVTIEVDLLEVGEVDESLAEGCRSAFTVTSRCRTTRRRAPLGVQGTSLAPGSRGRRSAAHRSASTRLTLSRSCREATPQQDLRLVGRVATVAAVTAL